MSHYSDTTTGAAGAQAAPRLREAERLPLWLSLWLPLAVAFALVLTWHLDPDFYRDFVVGETAPLESTHVIIPLIAAVVALRILLLSEVRRDPLVFVWVLLGLLGCVYMAGEEASWGQHYIGWLTPEGWQAVNDQGETNLHNTSAWLDQKPRTLLEIGVIVGGIVIPLLALRYPSIREGRFALFLPPMACLPVAVIGEIAKMSERLRGLGLWDGTIFYNASEVQELYIYLFILFYLIVFRNRLRARRAAGLPPRPAAAAH
ncbi:hypothetical protein AAFN88_19060 [Pelagibius sp. CAU 1746]|uniref:hypothetical protein n=1 Tax=Pelagibius sp. CAU 1746 TaxID=3140370 RepID=UPI00325B7CAA